jgi:hypothetical protein
MGSFGQFVFIGQSGQKHLFDLYLWGTTFEPFAAVFVVMDATTNTIIYIGESADMSEGIKNHPKAEIFSQYLANCICIHADDDAESRRAKFQDLVTRYSPIGNL